MPVIGNAPLFPAISLQTAVKLNKLDNGFYTLTLDAAGNVLSVQPDGSFQTRPAGTAGPYEQCGLNGNTLVYCPQGQSKQAYTFPYFDSVPNVQ